jgi:hypothetical protein
MSNSELIGCELTWRRDGAHWVLVHKRRRLGRVTPDREHRGMYRVALSQGRLSDMANLSWTKDAAMAAATRELEWEANNRAIHPPKTPAKQGCFCGHRSADAFKGQPPRNDTLQHVRQFYGWLIGSNLRTSTRTI